MHPLGMDQAADLPQAMLGVVASTARGAGNTAIAAGKGAALVTAPAVGLWRSSLGGPLRRRADAAYDSLSNSGAQAARRLQKRTDETVVAVARQFLSEVADSEIVVQVLNDPALTRLLTQIFESDFASDLTDKLLASEQLQEVIQYIASAPEVREVIAQQTAGIADDLADNLRGRTVIADDAAERLARALLRRRRAQQVQ